MSSVDPTTAAGSTTEHRTAQGHAARRSLRIVLAVLLAGVVATLRVSGVLAGPAGLVAAAVLVVLLPSARSLSRRVTVNLAWVAGAVPALWWVRVELPGARATASLAVAAAAVGWALGGRPADVLPRVRPVDAVPWLAAGASAAVLSPWLSVREPAEALRILLPGWDNSAHTFIATMLRQGGGTIDTLGAPPDGGTWMYVEYPSGLHALVATLTELWTPSSMGTVADLPWLTRSVALVVVAGTLLVSSALCSAAPLRARPWLAPALVAATTGALVLGPGATLPASGFANFWLAVVLVASATMLSLDDPQRHAHRTTWTLAALVVAAAHAWMMLAVLLALPVLLAWWARARRPGGLLPTAAAVTAAALGAAHAVVPVLGALGVTSTLTTGGGIETPDPGVLAAVLLAAVAAALLALGRRSGRDAVQQAVPLSVLMPGLLAVGALVLLQLMTTGQVTYYAWKLALGAALVALPIGGTALVLALPSPPVRPTATTLAASATLTLALTQAFGLAVPGLGAHGLAATAPGLRARGALLAHTDTLRSIADDILCGATAQVPDGALPVLLPAPGSKAHILNLQQWQLGLRGSWTVQANAASTLVAAAVAGQAAGSEGQVRAALAADDRVMLVVPTSRFAAVRTAAGDRAGRVVACTPGSQP